jgi:hypothetical protein
MERITTFRRSGEIIPDFKFIGSVLQKRTMDFGRKVTSHVVANLCEYRSSHLPWFNGEKLIQAVCFCLVLPFQISTGRPAYAMLLVWLTGRVSESHTRCHGYNTAWFVSDGTTGVSIVRIKVRLEWRHNWVFNGILGYTVDIVKGEWLLSYVTTHVSMGTGFYCYHTVW